ncbi:ATP-binding protein [Serpentinicella sp. ANB-PHB4]|uniref:PAS domain-containing hybrid sensor histidine kinase/response regulator n=1 Tax=Serpentinicella sp. ANB-PHB4 TaxID=3074076 RepID=UPI0028581E80|nr:response regulator [Serpentinicella sp. ANB-PHB4]MDR5658479.1 ATP-binding protein [Serpentinicella sp. ANB-PHB4]
MQTQDIKTDESWFYQYIIKDIINGTIEGILVLDQNSQVLFMNNKFKEIWQLKEACYSFKDAWKLAEVVKEQLVNDNDFIPDIKEIIKGKNKYVDILNLKNGKSIKRTYTPLVIENAYKGMVWHFELQNERNFNQIFNNASDAMILYSYQNNAPHFIDVNDKTCKLLGYTREEFLGLNIEDITAPKFRNKLVQVRKRIQMHGSVQEEWEQITKKGEIILVEVSVNRLKLNDKETYFMIARDIRKHKKIEEELEQARKKAEEANHLKSQFLANTSHEIRTPLNGVIGSIQLLKDTNLEGKQSEYIDYLTDSANRLYTLINSLLDLSKIESGHMEIEEKCFSIYHLCNRLKRHFKKSTENNCNDFDFNIDPTIPTKVIGDEMKVSQVLSNLIENSIKFTKNGQISINITKESCSKEHIVLFFTVTDTGIGIDLKEKNSILKPFHQVDASIARKYGGTGLGLAICKNIVELLGSKLDVESRKGEGTQFFFNLTFKKLSHEHKTKENKNIIPALNLNNINVLVVEDDFVNQKIISHTLSSAGALTSIASSGKEVFEILEEKHYDLILMDLHIPDMDGFEITKKIKERGIKVPIVAVTASMSPEDQIKCKNLNMEDYILKPIFPKHLIEKIDEILHNKPI